MELFPQSPLQNRYKPLWDAVFSLAIIAACLFGAVFLTESMRQYFTAPQNLILIYVLAIIIISVCTSYFYSIVGTFAGVFIYDYLISPPRFGFSITLGFPLTMLMMLMVSLTTCTLVAKIKSVATEALEANRKTEVVYHLTRSFIGADSISSLVKVVGENIHHTTGRDALFYLGDPKDGQTKTFFMGENGVEEAPLTSEALQQTAAKAYRKQPCGETDLSCWRLATGEEPLGVLCTLQGELGPLTPDERSLLQVIVVQTSILLEKLLLAEYRQRAEIKAETEQARSSLLRGISHDLRSPLTNILGTADVLMDTTFAQDDTALELLQGICTDTDWLLRMIENILTITRLQSDNMQVNKKLEAPEEVVAYAVGTIRKRYPNRSIRIVAPEELVLTPMDPILITQVIINFLENAIKNSPQDTSISVILATEADNIRISVVDRGRGLSHLEGRNLFELDPRQGRSTEDSSRGMGMGLSICSTIVKVHGGEIGAVNRPEGGARFWFTLPLPQPPHPPITEMTHGE